LPLHRDRRTYVTEIEFNPDAVVIGKVTATHRLTPARSDEVRHIVLSIDDPAFRFVEGQTVGVLVPGPHAFGNAFHHRRYSIASARPASIAGDQASELELLVRRCFSIDEVSGERHPGIASNHLCDARPGQEIRLTGPYRSPFKIPADPTSNVLMIGTGTGVAPFRGFVQRIYNQVGNWEGDVRLFYGGRTGMELYYMNDVNADLANYYKQETFRAFQALSLRPLSRPEQALEASLSEHAAEVWRLVQSPKTFVYLSGIGRVAEAMDRTLAKVAGSAEIWNQSKHRLIKERRWSEILYA